MLKVENISKRFGDIVALDDVSFNVDDGEFVFLTGPSGSGKTTLLRLITRDLLPDKGKIFFGDLEVTSLPGKFIPKLRRQMGVVFQDFKVLPERTVRENIEVALAVSGVDEKEWKDRVNQALDSVGIKQRSELFPSQLSGGELQRVSLARALVGNPKLILADEPTGNLDWETANSIMKLLQNINKQGKTVVVATHHELIIKTLKKRAINLLNGKCTI